jgi:hypothetical protein
MVRAAMSRVGQHGLGGPQRGLEAGRQREAFDGELRVIRRRIHDRGREALGGFELEGLGGNRGGGGNQAQGEAGEKNGRFHDSPGLKGLSARALYSGA